jgi:hypothetical protein
VLTGWGAVNAFGWYIESGRRVRCLVVVCQEAAGGIIFRGRYFLKQGNS